MAITYSDIEPHLPGTDQQIADALNADHRHLINPDIGPLQKLMARSGMLYAVSIQGTSGIITEAYPTFSPNNQRLADEFVLDLATRDMYPCANDSESGQVISGIIGLASANEADLQNGYTAASFTAAMNALTGGRRFGSVTAADVAAVRDLKSREDALQAVRDRADAAYEAAAESFRNGDDEATITLAAETAWGA